jgi:ribose transport system permease protein
MAQGSFISRYGLLLAWAAVIVAFSILRPETFPTIDNFATIFGTQAVLVILTLGLIIPLTAGDYDLSIAATLALSAMTVALLNVDHGWPILPAIGVALLAGAVVGLVNAAIVIKFEVDPFIATLGTATFLQGLILWVSDSRTIAGVSSSLTDAVIVNRLFGIPLAFWYGLVLVVVLWYVFERMPAGRRLLFVGRGRSVARLSGIRVPRVRTVAFIASGVLAAAAGVVYAGTTGSADPSSGLQFLLPAYAAAFLGSTSIVPGRFNPIGAAVAVYFLITGITGLQLLGAASYVQQLFYGSALILAVSLTQAAQRRRRERLGAAQGAA